MKPTSGMVSVLDFIIPSLLRERYLFTCSPMTKIMLPFWFVADCYMGHVLKNVMSCTKCEVTNCFVTWAIANNYTFYTHVREMYIIYGGIIFSLSSDVT